MAASTENMAGDWLSVIGESVYNVPRMEGEGADAYRARIRVVVNGPVPPPYSWRGDMPAPRPFRERWELLLAAILEAAPREARDGFNRRRGKAWDAFLVEVAGLREEATCGMVEPATAAHWAAAAWSRVAARGVL